MTSGGTVQPPRLEGAIRAFLGSRTLQRPVSIERLMRTARYALPDLSLTDDELAELIARELILERCDVDFDRGEPNSDLMQLPGSPKRFG